jgi:hypothetical protein
MDEETIRRIMALEGAMRSLGNRVIELQAQVRELGTKNSRVSDEYSETRDLIFATVVDLRQENRALFELERQNRKRELRRILRVNQRGNGHLAAWGVGISVIVLVGGLIAAKVLDAAFVAPTVAALLAVVAVFSYREHRVTKKEREDEEREERDSGSIRPSDMRGSNDLPTLRDIGRLSRKP